VDEIAVRFTRLPVVETDRGQLLHQWVEPHPRPISLEQRFVRERAKDGQWGAGYRTRRFWRDGTPIVPLNREPGSAAREAFSHQVLGGDSARWASYWNDAYFNGVFPPAVLSSSAAVKRYIASEAGAIGYVDPADVDDTVRVVLELRGSGAAPAR
jgi:ABC-type phosphate transport system substrate-binding protein